MVIDYGYGEREFCISAAAAMEYEQQFGADIVKDLFGKMEVSAEEIGEALAGEEPADGILRLDFTQTNWTACLKALWAGERAVEPRTPGFAEWCRERPRPDMNAVSGAVLQDATEAFFHGGAGGSE